MKFDKIKKYSKSSKHIDEKLQFLNSKLQQTNMLSEIPANNTSGIYVVEPEYIRTDIGEPEVPVDLAINGPNGRDTSGIFDYGISLMQDPPGDASYFLGPIVSIYDSDTNSTQIGYVRESDRHMVNLGRVAGTLDTWDGSSGFTSYGQLTAEQVSWYRTQYSSNKVADYPVFYTGLSRTQNNLLQTFDNFGRVVAQILNLPKQSYQIPNSKQFSSPIPPGGLSWYALPGPPSNFNVFYYDTNTPQQLTNYLIQRGQQNNLGSYLSGGNGPGSAINEPANSVQVNRLTGDDSGYVEVRINGKLSLRWLNIYNASDPMSDWIVGITNLLNLNAQPMTVQGTRKVTDTRVPPVMGPFDKNLVPGSALPKNQQKGGLINSLLNAIGQVTKTAGNVMKGLEDKINAYLKSAGSPAATYLSYVAAQLDLIDPTPDKPFRVPFTQQDAQQYSNSINDALNKLNIDDPSKMTQSDYNKLNKLITTSTSKSEVSGSSMGQSAYQTFYNLSEKGSKITKNPDGSITVTDTYQFDGPTDVAGGNVPGVKELLVLAGQHRMNTLTPAQRKNDIQWSSQETGDPRYYVNDVSLKPIYITATLPPPSSTKSTLKQSTEYSRRLQILKEVKKPYVLPEQKKVKITRRPRVIGSSMMKDPKIEQPFKQREENIWGRKEYQQNVRLSQGRMNEVLDRVGTGDHFWEWMTERNHQKGKDIAYNNFNVNTDKVKGKVVHKEEIRGDKILIVEDPETHKKSNILQSELNELLEKKFGHITEEPKEDDYTDSLYRKSLKKLGYNFEYDDKPSSKGYPNNPPPEMVNGWHPEYGKRDAMYNRMDPHSAQVMQRVKKLEKVKAVVKKSKETP